MLIFIGKFYFKKLKIRPITIKKIKEWLRRYGFAEMFATIGAIFSASLFYLLTDNRIIAAYAGVIGENIGFYGFISIRDYIKSKAEHKKNSKKFGLIGYAKIIQNLIIEFGFSEIIDSFISRPFCMYYFPKWIGNYSIGIIVGKLFADIIFYIPTIIAYELRKKYIK